jgi:hypothetical protein
MGGGGMKTISINRAPVLTLWAAVVAQRLGFDKDEALTLGKALAGLNTQAKGRRLGIFKPHEQKPKKAREKERGKRFLVEVCGRPVPATNTDDGIRAVKGAQVIEPDGVRRYLKSKFGNDLGAVRKTMQRLAKSYQPTELADHCYQLSEQFRPEIPAGTKGWGAKGDLDLGLIEGLALLLPLLLAEPPLDAALAIAEAPAYLGVHWIYLPRLRGEGHASSRDRVPVWPGRFQASDAA